MLFTLDFEYDTRFVIVEVRAREILDSRGNPTIETEIITEGGGVGYAAVPAGASKGKYEAYELRDRDPKRFMGKGVKKAVENVNDVISNEVIGKDSRLQWLIDKTMIELDGTENKSNLGANAILSVSLANARAAADTYGLPLFLYLGGIRANLLPTPMMNIINGGKHAGNNLSIQEFMIVPGGADTFSEALRMGVETYHSLKDYLVKEYGKSAINVGDEGGFAPPMNNTEEAINALINAIEKAGYSSNEIKIALDAAASVFYDEKDGYYSLDGKRMSQGELIDFYIDLVQKYPIISIEDPLHEDDFEGFKELTNKIGNKVLIVGDDLFVTNIKRFSKGIKNGAGNAILIKVNQVGTLSETLEIINLAHQSQFTTIISHRSGETEDNYIADIAVATNAGLIKTGAPARSDRTSKYNQLLRIENILGENAKFSGFTKFKL